MITIPLPHFGEDESAEVHVFIGGKKITYDFRIESFPWDMETLPPELANQDIPQSLAKIYQLKKAIAEYDNNWELLQIFTPAEGAKRIQVLYRQRKTENT